MNNNIIKSIDTTSPVRACVCEGDALISINGNRITDVLDYKFFAYDPSLDLVFRRPDGQEYSIHTEKREGGDLGLDFETYLMDAPRSCANNCIFCFIDQLPPGMRKTMYFKDDDARLSFLMGNYITLTNLSSREVQRIIDLHVSPVNISVHTTDASLRCAMLRSPRAGEALAIMQRFADGGIEMNCQIVCCPDVNDGAALDKTMRDLASIYPAVNSVSVVPVGLTKFRDGLAGIKPFTPEKAAEVLDQVTAFGTECLEEHGSRIFFCGDELYLLAGRELPPDEFYEAYTQLENGVGMLRLLETEFTSALRLSEAPETQHFSIATGVSAAPFLKELVRQAEEKYPQLHGSVYAIENDFFGHSITVAGLVTGQDLISQLKGRELGTRLLIPQNMLRRAERDFLDDVTLAEASAALGVEICPVEQDGFALWDAVSGVSSCGDESNSGACSCVCENEEFYRYN